MKSYACDDLDLLAYLSGGLLDEERAAADEHLAACATCQRELELLRQAGDFLPLALNPVTPPESLRAKVLTEAFERRPPVTARGEDRQGAHSSRQPSLWTRRILPWALSAALLAVSVGLASEVVHDRQQLSGLRLQLAGASKTVSLQPTRVIRDASGQAVVIPDGSGVKLIVYIAGVKPTKGSQVYHVWLLNHGTRLSGGVIRTSPRGVGMLQVSLTGARAEFDEIGITLEPNAKTTVPMGPKVLGANAL